MDGLGSREQLLIDEFRAACHALADRLDGMVFADDDDRRIKMRYLFYFTKGSRTFAAFARLVEDGYTDEARILTRANFELVVDLLCFDKAPKDFAQQLGDWLEATEWEAQRFGTPSTRATTDAEAAKSHFCAKYDLKKFPKHWSGKDTIECRARAVGLADSYEGPYRFMCSLAHGGAYAIASYLDLSSPDIAGFRISPDWADSAQVVREGCIWLLDCLHSVAEGLQLSSYEVIHRLHVLLHGTGPSDGPTP